MPRTSVKGLSFSNVFALKFASLVKVCIWTFSRNICSTAFDCDGCEDSWTPDWQPSISTLSTLIHNVSSSRALAPFLTLVRFWECLLLAERPPSPSTGYAWKEFLLSTFRCWRNCKNLDHILLLIKCMTQEELWGQEVTFDLRQPPPYPSPWVRAPPPPLSCVLSLPPLTFHSQPIHPGGSLPVILRTCQSRHHGAP